MKAENREMLLRTIGVIDGLFFQAPKDIQDALECIGNNLEYILKKESEDKE